MHIFFNLLAFTKIKRTFNKMFYQQLVENIKLIEKQISKLAKIDCYSSEHVIIINLDSKIKSHH